MEKGPSYLEQARRANEKDYDVVNKKIDRYIQFSIAESLEQIANVLTNSVKPAEKEAVEVIPLTALIPGECAAPAPGPVSNPMPVQEPVSNPAVDVKEPEPTENVNPIFSGKDDMIP